MSGKSASKRFIPGTLSDKLVPVLFGLILIGLLAVLILVAMSSLGIIPGV